LDRKARSKIVNPLDYLADAKRHLSLDDLSAIPRIRLSRVARSRDGRTLFE
ncbi:MAG: hypothetical protein QOF01_4405, partial [Thermomicrobiales bacterium]|nr:hypothetical protein [Thermomicrobiales bacterium]